MRALRFILRARAIRLASREHFVNVPLKFTAIPFYPNVRLFFIVYCCGNGHEIFGTFLLIVIFSCLYRSSVPFSTILVLYRKFYKARFTKFRTIEKILTRI